MARKRIKQRTRERIQLNLASSVVAWLHQKHKADKRPMSRIVEDALLKAAS